MIIKIIKTMTTSGLMMINYITNNEPQILKSDIHISILSPIERIHCLRLNLLTMHAVRLHVIRAKSVIVQTIYVIEFYCNFNT